jgi:hypothetical protein
VKAVTVAPKIYGVALALTFHEHRHRKFWLWLERLTIEMLPGIVGRERLKIFPPRLEGRCPFQPYKKYTAFHS